MKTEATNIRMRFDGNGVGQRGYLLMLVSVIIPALNEAENIQSTIAAARRDYRPEEVEIIVIDGGSTDGTPDLIPQDVLLLAAPRGRAAQMNYGAQACHGDILLFCHADSQLPAGWREAVLTALQRPRTSGGTFQLRLHPARGLFMRIYNRLHTPTWWWIMFGDQAQFMSRATFRHIGGFPTIPLMEDVEMARALHHCGNLVRPPLRVTTSSRRFLEKGVMRQLFLDAWCLVRYLLLGATPEQVARLYRSSREETL